MNNVLKYGYWLAGLTNIAGILMVSSFFTSEAFLTPFPTIFGEFGSLMIMVWGLAYWSVAGKASETLWPAVVFAIEKLVYVLVWLFVVLPNLDAHIELIDTDPMAGLFFRTFGLIDLAYGVFFAYAARRVWKQQKG